MDGFIPIPIPNPSLKNLCINLSILPQTENLTSSERPLPTGSKELPQKEKHLVSVNTYAQLSLAMFQSPMFTLIDLPF